MESENNFNWIPENPYILLVENTKSNNEEKLGEQKENGAVSLM